MASPTVRHQVNRVPPESRTMFVTFSRGYPIAEDEIRLFFESILEEDCIEACHMQVVKRNNQHPLYAKVVFYEASTIDLILDGMRTIKFAINGKHMWVRKFIPVRYM